MPKRKPKEEEIEDQDEEQEEEPEEEEVDEEEEEEETEEADDEDGEDEADDDDDEKPAKGSKTKKKGGAKKGNLVPRTPVTVPKDVLKNSDKEIRKLLTQRDEAIAKGDKDAQRKIRMLLRKKGFRLSDLNK